MAIAFLERKKRFSNKLNLSFALFLTIILSLTSDLYAINGLRTLGADATQISLAGSGVAMPTTPTAPFLNPAGLNDVVDEANLNFTVIFPSSNFGSSLAPLGNPEAVNVGGEDDPVLLPSGGIANNLFSPRLAFGVTVYGSSGVSVDYNLSRLNPSFTNNQYDKTALYANIKIIPTFSYQVLDNLTVGAGLDINYSFFKGDLAVPGPGFPETSGMQRFDSALGVGGRVGVIYKPLKWLRVGAIYILRSRFHQLDRYTDLFFTGLDLPQQVAFGLAFLPIDGMTILTDFRWIDWSSGLIGTSPLQGGLGWRDQYIGIIGFSYDFHPKFKVPLTFRMGYNYGRSPITPAVAFPNIFIPLAAEHDLTTGLGIEVNKHIGFDLAYWKEFSNSVTDDGSLNPGATGSFVRGSSHVFSVAVRGHWGQSAKKRADKY